MNYQLASFAGYWWVVLLRGIIAFLFGIAIFIWPGITLALLILMFAAFVLADGIMLAVHSLMSIKTDSRWWLRLLQGIVAVIAGIAVLMWPGLTALVLLYIIAFNAILGGAIQATTAILYRKAIRGELLLIAGGIMSVIFGALLLMYPLTGALALIKVIGIFEIFYGILLMVMSFDLLSMSKAAPARA